MTATTTTDDRTRELAEPEAGPIRVPRHRYTSPEYLQLEYERLWPRVWQLACREEEIADVGDYYEYVVGRMRLLVVRVAPDRIAAYHNTCLHRGTTLKHGCGNAPNLRCRYHAWTWNLDGSIAHVPDREDFADEISNDEELALPEVSVDTWGGFVFVNPAPDPEPLREFLAPMPEVADRYRLDKMKAKFHVSTVVPANWKVVLDSFNEGYHVQGTHPQMLQYYDDTATEYHAWASGHNNYWGAWARTMGKPSPRLGEDPDVDPREILLAQAQDFAFQQLITRDDLAQIQELCRDELPEGLDVAQVFADMKRRRFENLGIDMSHFDDEEIVEGTEIQLFPNVIGPVQPGIATIFRIRPNGDDPDSCIWDMWTLARFPDGEEPEMTRTVVEDCLTYEKWGPIMSQDMANMPHIQAGLHAGGDDWVRLGAQEINIRNFHRLLEQYVGS